MAQPRFLIAGPLWLDREDERLWHDGKPVRLGGRALGLLGMLMERSRTLVTKDDLLDEVWPGVAVTESVLTTAVKEIRQALGDNARSPRFIETAHGRGYRFLLPAEARETAPEGGAAQPAPARAVPRGWLAAALAVLLAGAGLAVYLVADGPATPDRAATSDAFAPHPKSIAVLSFRDLSEGSDQQWFAAGLTEEVLNSLARTPDLRVAARMSTLSLAPADARTVGRQLNVAHIVEGTVRRDGGRVRVTAQLIRTSDGFQVWSQGYDRAASDIVSIQEDMAVAIARALDTVMSPGRLQAMVSLGTRSIEAYEEFLRGLAYERRALATGDQQNVRQSYEAFERARTIDPGFAAAQWRAAQAWFGNATRVGSSVTERRGTEDQRLREYLARVDAAIAASAGRPEQFRYRSARALNDLQLPEALKLMRRYLDERPRDLDAWDELVDLAGYNGDRALMAHAAERIHAISMESGAPRSRAITASVLSMDIDNAVRRARQQLVRSPGEAMIQYQAHRAFIWGGHRDEARAVLIRLRSSSLPAENKLLAELRQACADGGQGARDVATELARLPGASTSSAWQAAVMLGDTGRAVAILKPLDRPDRLTTLIQYLVYPTFDSRPFPLLAERLKANGIDRAAPVESPSACPAGPSGPVPRRGR